MDTLTLDLLGYLTEFINDDADKFHFVMTCKEMSKCNYYFYGLADLDKIIYLEYFNNRFTNIFISTSKNIDKISPVVRKITFGRSFDKSLEGLIPSFITHIVIDDFFDQVINDSISSSVTHLAFGWDFPTKFATNNIPEHNTSRIDHINLNTLFNKPIKDCIPSSVKHLSFGTTFSLPIDDIIPSSITHLSFGDNFFENINVIPSSVYQLTLNYEYFWNNHFTHRYYGNKWNFDFPKSIKKLIIRGTYRGMRMGNMEQDAYHIPKNIEIIYQD